MQKHRRAGEGSQAVGDNAGLYRRFEPAIRQYLRRRVNSASDLDDMVQEVFLRLLKRTDGDAIENLEGYLFHTAANLLAERGRKASVRSRAPAISVDESFLGTREEPSPERILVGRETYQQVVACLLELPERTRSVFILSRYEELTGRQIAQRLGLSVSAVEKHLCRALAHLRGHVR